MPDDARQVLAHQARSNGQSLQAFLLSLVIEEARRRRNVALLDRFIGRSDGSLLTAETVVEVIHRGREEREAHLLQAIDGSPDGGIDRH